ncbi:MAG: site-specific integrase [Proteobacteria bacterium]|nr:site-specific integrase [Pseudomonadota bacterium]MBU1595236.1 site-specific integrase [Pseudomonadota bacterium]
MPDRYYALSYWWAGKANMEGVGWASEGVKPSDCFDLLEVLKGNQRLRQGPCTLAEFRQEGDRKKRASEEALLVEEKRRVTLERYFEIEYAPVARTQKKTSTWVKEEQHFKSWIGPLLGRERLEDIDLPHWDDLVKALAAAGLSTRTKEYVTGSLRRVMRFAYDRRVISNPPPSGKRIGCVGPGNSNRRTRVISPAVEAEILAALAETDLHAEKFVRFGFLTGARASEIFNLRWANVDFVRCVVTFTDTKNKETRELPMTGSLEELLQSIPQGNPDSYVFTKPSGQPYEQGPKAYYDTVKRLGLNDGRIEHDKITFHSIRHTVATRLARRLTIRELMDVMGWKVMAMAARYIKSDDKTVRSAMESLGQKEGGKVVPFKRVAAE